MRKIRELLNHKKTKWMAGGMACLGTAVVLLVLGTGIGVKAENMVLGTGSDAKTLSFTKSGTIYEITGAEQLAALGSATAEQTRSKTFQLQNDIHLDISKAVSGTFDGTFDGNGHVVTITADALTSEGVDTAASEGLLFGTVTGKVENLIVDIQGDVTYKRTSTVTIEELPTSIVTSVTTAASAPYDKTEQFSIYSTDLTASGLAQKFNDNQMWGTQITKETVGTNTYYVYAEEETLSRTAQYSLKTAKTDQFGIICGTLANGAAIDQVYILGNENSSLKVTQEAKKVNTESTEEGKRKALFYYEQQMENYSKDAEQKVTQTAEAQAIKVYSNETLSENAGTLVKLNASVPKYVEKGQKLVYTVQVNNTGSSDLALHSLNASLTGGEWHGQTGTKVTAWDNEVISAGNTAIYQYEIIPTGITVTSKFALEYHLIETPEESQEEEAPAATVPASKVTVADMTSYVIDTAAVGTSAETGSQLKLTLTPEKNNYIDPAGRKVTYTLKIVNKVPKLETEVKDVKLTINANDIKLYLGSDTTAEAIAINWIDPDTEQVFTRKELSSDETLVLQTEVSIPEEENGSDAATECFFTAQVSPSAQSYDYGTIPFYKYLETPPTGKDLWRDETFENLEFSEAAYSGNHLNAGIVAGTSKGTITKVKQNLTIQAMQNAGNTAVLKQGGVIGFASTGATASDLYILGTDNYAGAGSQLPPNSVVKTGAKPSGDAWDSYYKYDQNFAFMEAYDLKWLIKNGEDTFSYEAPSAGKVKVTVREPKTDQGLAYDVIYQARKSLSDTKEDTVYEQKSQKTDGFGSIELGNSGFYKLFSVYATDGYYHFNEAVLETEKAETVFPYDGFTTTNPYAIKLGDDDRQLISIIRSTDPSLEDHVQVQLNTTFSGEIYFNTYEASAVINGIPYVGDNSSTASSKIDSSDTFTMPFDRESVQYQFVPAAIESGTGKTIIYPAQLTSPAFQQTDKQPIPRPKLTCDSYYSQEGTKNPFKVFTVNGNYEAGSEMHIQPRYVADNSTDYTIRYLFSETALKPGEWSLDVEDDYKYRYTGTDKAFMNSATVYENAAVVPKDMVGENRYLYVEISAKNHVSQIYYFGPFHVIEKEKVTASVPVEQPIIEGDEIKLTGTREFQWMVTNEPKTSFETSAWISSENKEAVVDMSIAKGSYIYARVKYEIGDTVSYGEVAEFAYTYGGTCADPRMTPTTAVGTGDAKIDEISAAPIDASQAVSISSLTAGANIFYRVTDQLEPMIVEKINRVPDGITEDGDSDENFVYYKVGSRWYKTLKFSENPVTRYIKGESIYFSNPSEDAKLQYISVIAIAEGYESSSVLNYVYRVKPAQKVAAPEASIETYHTPGGLDVERQAVQLGAKISFYSVTANAQIYRVDPSTETIEAEPLENRSLTVTGDYGGTFAVTLIAKKEGMLDSERVTFVYDIEEQARTAKPTATPDTSVDVPTTVLPGNKILLSTMTKEAEIYYTIDGTSPEVEETTEGFQPKTDSTTKKYDPSIGIVMPVDGKGYFSIKAVAVKKGLAESEEAQFVYNYPDTVQKPYATKESGKVALNTKVLLKNLTEGATIYYNVVYGDQKIEDPTLSSSVFNESYPFVITQKTTIRAMAAKNGVKSEVVEFVYDPMDQLAAPTASISSGSVVARGSVLTLHAADGAVIYYTMDGSDPTDSLNAAVMTGTSLILNGEAGGQITIKAFARAMDKSQSEVVTFTYQFSQNTGGVTASIASGSEVSNGTKVNLMSDVTNGDIYYTTDGSSPITYGTRGTTVELKGTPGSTVSVKAVVLVDQQPGIISTFIYKIKEKPTTPTASPAGGTLTVATTVTLSSSGEKIYYTTDGTTPTKSSSLYSEPIMINRATTLQAISVSADGELSDVAVFTYAVSAKASNVRSSLADGSVLSPGEEIYLSTSVKGAQIYYSTDGTVPTINNLDEMLLYDGEAISINRSVVIRAVAYRSDLRLSDVKSWAYTVETIPAVEQKREEAKKIAEEGLKDTDATKLSRKTDDTDRLIKRSSEKKYGTSLSYSEDAFEKKVTLETAKEENNPYTVQKAKGIFGEETTVLTTYKMKAKEGTFSVQPEEEVEIAFPIPEGYENATLTVASLQDDYHLITLETRREEDVLYAKTDHIGKYVLIGPERMSEESVRLSYILILEMVAVASLFGGILCFFNQRIKKYRKRK